MKASNQPLGIGCLGPQYMYAHDHYYSMGDHFFNMATQKGQVGILPAVKKCFVTAGQNLKNIVDKVDNPEKKA